MMRKFDEARTHDLLQTINRQSIWLTDMINELLDLARIEARKGNDFRLEVVALTENKLSAQGEGGCPVLVHYENAGASCDVALGEAWRVRPAP